MSNQDPNPQQSPQYQPAPQIIIQQAPRKKPYFLYGCGGCLTTLVLMSVIGSMGAKTAIDRSSSSGSTSSGTTQGETQSDSSAAETNSKPSADQQPVIEVSAGQLFDKYQSNEVAADNLYKDKTLLVSGTVQDIGKDMMDDSYVNLKTGNSFMPVRCVFETSEKAKLAQLSKGQTVSIRGICHGSTMGSVTIAYATFQ